MFKLNQTKTYWTPVVVEIPADGGRFEKSSLEVCFRRLTRDEFTDLQKRLNDKEITDLELCKKVVHDWKKVVDEDGNEVPFNESNLSMVDQDVVQFVPAVILAFFNSITKVREKN